MKFSQLPVNESFSFEGENYRKVSPIIAVNLDTGNQRMISRAAVVAPVAGEPQEKAGGSVEKAVVRAELDRYHRQLQDYIAASDDFASDEARQAFTETVNKATQALLTGLDL